jgi:hypothetical protein
MDIVGNTLVSMEYPQLSHFLCGFSQAGSVLLGEVHEF